MRIGNHEIPNPLKPLKELMIDEFNSKSEGEKLWITVSMNLALIFLIVVMFATAMTTAEYMKSVEERVNLINTELGRPYVLGNFSLPKFQNCSCQPCLQPGTSSANLSNQAGYKS